jgi:penicillin amidase
MPALLLVMVLVVSGTGICGCSQSGSSGGNTEHGVAPQLVEYLTEAADVYRDEWGIPHIYARGRGNVLFLQGYEMARDRIFHMDYLRRSIYGTQAEVYGPSYLDDDITKRMFGFRRMAESNQEFFRRNYPELIDLIQSYCNGVNAYIEDMMTGRNGAVRPVEFDRIDPAYRPEPWEVRDVFAIAKAESFSQTFLGDMEMFIYAARNLLRSSAYDIIRFQPIEPTHILEPSVSTWSGRAAYKAAAGAPQPPLSRRAGTDRGSLEQAAEALLTLALRLGSAFGGSKGLIGSGGSNSWVIHERLAENRSSLLCNDPHMNLDYPSTMYATHIIDTSTDMFGAIGNVPPGAPLVLIGHTGHVAWGITNAFGDATDLYREDLSRDRKSVRFRERWVPIQFFEERIAVRPDGAPLGVTEEVVHSVRWVPHHGPILTDLLPEDLVRVLENLGLVLSARWTGFSEETTDIVALARLMDAETVRDALDVLSFFNSGIMSWVVADSAGHIGYVAAGAFPRRPDPVEVFPPLYPLPGDGFHEWEGRCEYLSNPMMLDPAKGYIVTANNSVTDQVLDNDPFNDERYVGHFFDVGVRAWRITSVIESLKARGPIALEDLSRLQTDDYSVLADELLPYLFACTDRICRDPSSEQCKALGILERWNRRFERDSPGASLFSVWFSRLIHNTFHDDIPPFLLGQASPYLAQIAARDLCAWLSGRGPASGLALFDDKETHGEVETPEDLMVRSLFDTVSTLREYFGEGRPMETWRWGEIHRKRFAHVVWDDLSQGYFEQDGGLFTVDPAEYRFVRTDGSSRPPPYDQGGGAVFRFCVEMRPGDWRTYNVLPGGESGHWGSEHYADQLPFYLSGVALPLWYLPEDVVSHAESHRHYPRGFPAADLVAEEVP